MNTISTTTLHNGITIPNIIFHIQYSDNNTYASIVSALRQGYRCFDIPSLADIERDFAKATSALQIPRDSLFLIIHIPHDHYMYDKAIRAFRNSLSRLNTDYADMVILDIREIQQSTDKVISGWKALETAYKNGATRTIGILTNDTQDIETLLTYCEISPMANQAYYYPGITNKHMLFACQEHRIQIQAYLPENKEILQAKELQIFADKYRTDISHILLAFYQQKECQFMASKQIDASILTHNHIQISEDDMKYLDVMKDHGI